MFWYTNFELYNSYQVSRSISLLKHHCFETMDTKYGVKEVLDEASHRNTLILGRRMF